MAENNENLINNEDDLEDGEIETDDEDDNEQIANSSLKEAVSNQTTADNNSTINSSNTITNNSNNDDFNNSLSSEISTKQLENNVISKKQTDDHNINNSDSNYKNDNCIKIDLTATSNENKLNNHPSSSNKSLNVPTNKKSKNKFVDDDWAGNIENAIAAALKREGVVLPEHERDRDREYIPSDDNGSGIIIVDTDNALKSRNKSSKKRKKRDGDKKVKKRMKHQHDDDPVDEIDDYEMLCIRGGSPPPHSSISQMKPYYDSDHSYSSYDSFNSQEYKNSSYQDRRQIRKNRDRRRKDMDSRKKSDKRKRDERDEQGVCLSHMRGYCREGDECPRTHDCRAQRKLELCKFYLMDCCAKKEKCSYMHSDFPCKYYYLGMECIYKSACKFSHGKPLTEQLRNILLKHIETAPKEILGNFRRISRENAASLISKTHAKLCAEQGIENTMSSPTSSVTTISTAHSNMEDSSLRNSEQIQNTLSSIPSLLDMVIKPPTPHRKDDKLLNMMSGGASKAEKQRKSRWCDTSNNLSPDSDISAMSSSTGSMQTKMMNNSNGPDILSLRNLTGVISPEQIEKLAAMGIENLEQVNQLTVAQLNNLGLTISQINEIQLNALNIQKLGLIKSPPTGSTSTPSYLGNITTSTSTVTSPSSTSPTSTVSRKVGNNHLEFINPSGLYSDTTLTNQTRPTQDVDMRFLIGGVTSSELDHCSSSNQMNLTSTGIASPDAIHPARTTELEKNNDLMSTVSNSNLIDYSQYLKDSNLDAEKTDLNDISLDRDDTFNEDEPGLLIDESWMDPNDAEDNDSLKNENCRNSENNFRKSKTPSPEYWTVEPRESNNRKTVPMDEENWDSDNECNEKSKQKDDSNDGDSISASTSESREFRDPRLYKTQQQNTLGSYGLDYMNTAGTTSSTSDSIFSYFRDSMLPTISPGMSSPNASSLLDVDVSTAPKRYQRTSIYDGTPGDVDDDASNTRKKCDKDMRMSSFIDSSSNSDIDLRLPFKPVMTNYTPATEIDGSISSHSPIVYKVVEVEIPKPNYNEIRRSIPVSDKTLDPRLRRMFCLKDSSNNNNDMGSNQNDLQFSTGNKTNTNMHAKRDEQNEKTVSSITSNTTANSNSSGPRADPRRRKENQDMLTVGRTNSTTDTDQGVDLRMILQKSNWYKNLNSKFKIMVNQQLAVVSTELKKFKQDTSPNKVLDMTFIATNQCIQQILTNLCIYIDSNGKVRQLEGDNDGDDSSTMLGGMGMGGMGNNMMDQNTVTSNVVGTGGPVAMPVLGNMPVLQGSAVAAAAAGIYMRQRYMEGGNNPGGNGGNLLASQLRHNIRPGLLGIAPGIHYNPFDMNNMPGNNETGMGGGGGGDEQNNFNPFLNNGGNLFDQNNYFNRGNDSNVASNNRGMRNNYRQNGNGGGGNGRNNQNDRWNTGGGGGGGGQGISGLGNMGQGNRDNNRRNFDGKNRDGRRDKSQKL